MNIIQRIKYKIYWTYKLMLDMSYHKRKLEEFMRYYKDAAYDDSELNEAVQYIRKNGLKTIPYSFTDNLCFQQVPVHQDMDNGLYYVVRDNKRLYFKRSMTPVGVQKLYANLMMEQHADSPHRYFDGNFTVSSDDVFVDVGCAEGIISLDVVEKARKICLFECDESWVEALKATFRPWKHKVEIIQRYVSDCDNDNCIRLDSFFKNREEKPGFVKMDVEGAEAKVLEGMKLLSKDSENMKIAVCTYHRKEDYKTFSDFMLQRGFHVSGSKGYMLFLDRSDFTPPYFRKGLIRAEKCC